MGISIRNKQAFRSVIFNRGQNSTSEQTTLPVGYAALIENGIINDLGKIKERDGITRVGDDPAELVLDINFNGRTIEDSSASTQTITYNTVTFTDGKFGYAAKFGGTGADITVAADSTINVTDMGPFRFSCFIKGADGTIANKFSGTDIGFEISVASGEVTFEVGYDDTNAKVVTTDAAIDATDFYKLDCIMLADNSLDVLVDGSVCSYGTDTTGIGTANDDSAVDLVIGDGSSLILDDVRLYDGTFTTAALALSKINGITRFDVGTTVDTIYRANGTRLEELDADYLDWTYISGTALDGTLSVEFVQAKDLLFMFQYGKNALSMNTSKAITDEGDTNTDPPQGSTGEYMPNNRLFVAGTDVEGDRDSVFFSDPLTPQTFDRAVNRFKVRSGGGGRVTKLKRWRQNELVIYKEDSIFVLTDTNMPNPLTDWTLLNFHPTIGCKAPKTVVSLGDEHFFLANDGVRGLSRTQFDEVRNGVISDNIRDIIDRINKDQISKACAEFYDNKYILAVPLDSATENNFVLIYDTLAAKVSENPSDGWTIIPLRTWYPSCFCEFEFSDNKNALIYGDDRALSLVYRAFNGNNDDGENIVLQIRGPEHNVGYVQDAVWNPLFVVAESGDTTEMIIDARVNRKQFERIGVLDVGGTGGVDLPVDLPFSFTPSQEKTTNFLNTKQLGRGKTFQVQITHSDYNKDGFIFNEYTIYASPKGAPRGS